MKSIVGTYDILPDEIEKWQYVEAIVRDVFESFNYSEIRTPIFEETELFERSIGSVTDIVQKEMFTFKDRGGRDITLRPEGTAGCVRAFIEHNISHKEQLIKLYYIGPMFRAEKPQKGRYRQFMQFGTECIGSENPLLDVETILMNKILLEKFSLKEIKIYINSIGCKNCRAEYIVKLKEYMKANFDSLCDECKNRAEKNPLRILDCKNCKEVMQKSPVIIDYLCNDCSTHFKKVQTLLGNCNIEYEINNHLVRGLDYYTKTAFEIISNKLGAQNTIIGGGRYDNLISKLGGDSIPAIGAAGGFERLLLAIDEEKIQLQLKQKNKIFIAVQKKELESDAFIIANRLRSKGLVVEIDYLGRSLKSQLKTADRIGVRYTLIYGEAEKNNNTITVRDMKTSTQSSVSLQNDELIRRISKEEKNT